MNKSHPKVNSFRLSHEAILTTIARIQPLTRSYLQAKPLFIDLREQVYAYLGRQDQEFYKELTDCFSEDRPALKMLDFLQHDLKELKIKSLSFFERHSGDMGDMNQRHFIRNFREFMSAFMDRVKMEEDYLFPLMSRLPFEEIA